MRSPRSTKTRAREWCLAKPLLTLLLLTIQFNNISAHYSELPNPDWFDVELSLDNLESPFELLNKFELQNTMILEDKRVSKEVLRMGTRKSIHKSGRAQVSLLAIYRFYNRAAGETMYQGIEYYPSDDIFLKPGEVVTNNQTRFTIKSYLVSETIQDIEEYFHVYNLKSTKAIRRMGPADAGVMEKIKRKYAQIKDGLFGGRDRGEIRKTRTEVAREGEDQSRTQQMARRESKPETARGRPKTPRSRKLNPEKLQRVQKEDFREVRREVKSESKRLEAKSDSKRLEAKSDSRRSELSPLSPLVWPPVEKALKPIPRELPIKREPFKRINKFFIKGKPQNKFPKFEPTRLNPILVKQKSPLLRSQSENSKPKKALKEVNKSIQNIENIENQDSRKNIKEMIEEIRQEVKTIPRIKIPQKIAKFEKINTETVDKTEKDQILLENELENLKSITTRLNNKILPNPDQEKKQNSANQNSPSQKQPNLDAIQENEAKQKLSFKGNPLISFFPGLGTIDDTEQRPSRLRVSQRLNFLGF